MKQITVEHLRAQHACAEQVKLFVDTFGQAAQLTQANLRKAIAVGLQIDWLERLLDAPAYVEFERVTAPPRAEYERITALAWAEYKCSENAAYAEYQRIRDAAWAVRNAKYEHSTAPAWVEFERIAATAWTKYKRIIAPELLKLLKRME